MKQEGPPIELLHQRLAQAPLALVEDETAVTISALVHDLLYSYSSTIQHGHLQAFKRSVLQCPWYTTSQLLVYFFADSSFRNADFSLADLRSSLETTARELHEAGKNRAYVDDMDRREEFIRVALASLSLRPKGETTAQAEDRLHSVSSSERMKVLRASQAAEERAAKIRSALARKAALEAANKMTRE